MKENIQIATLAGGCFWCTEAIFRRLEGVLQVVPGYTGGTVDNPNYEDVCSGITGHAEAIQIQFNPDIISYEKLLEIFWLTHDPTTKNRQGNDVGTQYRSAIFFHSRQQKLTAEKIKDKLQHSGIFNGDITTEIVPITTFYEAEAYHKEYYEKNAYQPYCSLVIDPKVRKLLKEFEGDIKKEFRE